MNKTIDSFEETKTEEISADAPKVSLAEKPKRKRRFGDRYDGYRVKKLDTQFWIVPNIMRTRTDSQVFFNEVIGVGELDRYIHKKREGEIPNLRMIHVIIAATIRLFAERPRLNRFIAGKKIFAHNNIRLSMSIKRSMTDDGEETELAIPDERYSPERLAERAADRDAVALLIAGMVILAAALAELILLAVYRRRAESVAKNYIRAKAALDKSKRELAAARTKNLRLERELLQERNKMNAVREELERMQEKRAKKDAAPSASAKPKRTKKKSDYDLDYLDWAL